MDPKGRILAEPSAHLDHFYLLPDKVVLLIFNQLADVRSLGRCSAVCRRFNSLVFLVHDVYIKIDRVVTADGDFDDPFCPSSPGHRKSNFLKLILIALLKPSTTFPASKEVTSLSSCSMGEEGIQGESIDTVGIFKQDTSSGIKHEEEICSLLGALRQNGIARCATLVTIKPSSDENTAGSSRAETDAFISRSFDNPFKAAVKALMKRRTYLLEMNGF